ncbi:MAG: DUF5123 domain-containing protein [bacterium]|nr:MAG: DUF5123 domain-containing protein [bacterium]
MKIKFLTTLVLSSIAACLVSAGEIPVSPGTNQISAALVNTSPGDILVLEAGTYIETNSVFTAPHKVTIRGIQKQTVWKMTSETVEKKPAAKASELGTEFSVAVFVQNDLCLENIIFDFDNVDIGVENWAGSVSPGEEHTVAKNNIYIDHCELRNFTLYAIHVADASNSPYDEIMDEKNHPIDTLQVTNSLFYNGGYMGIRINHGQGRVVTIKNCTFWKIFRENLKVYGHETFSDYFHYFVDHCTLYNAQSPQKAIGLYIRDTDADDTVQNCIFYKLRSYGIHARSGNWNQMTVQYCIGDSCGDGVYSSNIQTIMQLCLEEDPQFTDPDNGDFSLQQGSLAVGFSTDGIDCGNPLTNWSHIIQTEVEEKSGTVTPTTFSLEQNFPNPFNQTTTISYSVAKPGVLSLDIYNIKGQKIRMLFNENKASGSYSVVWDSYDDYGKSVSSGVYFYRLTSGEIVKIKKMLLLN